MELTLTNAGQALMIRGLTGETIRFTKVKIGDNNQLKDWVEDPKALTDLVRPLYETEFDSVAVEDGHAKLTWSVNTEDLRGHENFGTVFFWSETGIFAADPDSGEDILYAYHTGVDQDPTKTESENIRPATQLDYETYIAQEISVYVGDTVDVEAEIRKHLPYVPQEDFQAHTENRENPHGVTWQQTGVSREVLGIHVAERDVTASNKYFTAKTVNIPFTELPETAVLFFSQDMWNVKVTTGSPGVVFEKGYYADTQTGETTGWSITVKMYNFTGTVRIKVLGIG